MATMRDLDRHLAERAEKALHLLAHEPPDEARNFEAWERWLKLQPRQPGMSLRENSEYAAKRMHDLVASGVPLNYETLSLLGHTTTLNGEVNFRTAFNAFKQDPRIHRWLIGQGREGDVINFENSDGTSSPPTEQEREYAFQSLKNRVEESLKRDPASLLPLDGDGDVVDVLARHHPDRHVADWAKSVGRRAEDAVADQVVERSLKSNKLSIWDVVGNRPNNRQIISRAMAGLGRHPQIFKVLSSASDSPSVDQELFDRATGAPGWAGLPGDGRTPTPEETARLLDNPSLWGKIYAQPDLALEALPHVKNREELVRRVLGRAPDEVSREHMLKFGGDHTELLNVGLKNGKIGVDDLVRMLHESPQARESALRARVSRVLHPGQPATLTSPLGIDHLREVLPKVLDDLKSGASDSPRALAEHDSLDAQSADQLFDAARSSEVVDHGAIKRLTENRNLGSSTISKILNDRSLDLRMRRNVVSLPNATKQHEEQAINDPLLFSAVAGKVGADPDNLRKIYRRYEGGGQQDPDHHLIAPLWSNPSTPSDVIDRHVQAFYRDYEALKNIDNEGKWNQHESLLHKKYAGAVRDIAQHESASAEALRLIHESHGAKNILSPGQREELEERLALEAPDHTQGVNAKRVSVRVGSARFRRARDHILASGKTQLPPKSMIAGDWGVARAPNGDISAERLDQHVAKMPEMNFNVTYGRWGTKLEGKSSDHSTDSRRRHRLAEQRHSAGISKVFQLNLTNDHVRQMKDAGVFDTFKKVYEASKYSNHPVGKAGVGWVRWTGGKMPTGYRVFVDEVQSDFGGFGRGLEAEARAEARKQREWKQLSPEAQAQAKAYEDEFVRQKRAEFDAEYPPEHLKKINQIVFGGHKPNEVIFEAFHQHLRDKGFPDATVHIHSVESKKKQMLDANYFEEGDVPAHFQHTYEQLPRKMGMQPARYGELETEKNPDMEGLPVWGGPVRKTEGLMKMLGKSEREKSLTEVASVAVFDPRGRLLFGRRSDSKKWTLPGGHAEPNEDPDDCARRELKEEAGIELPHDRFTFLGTGRVNGVVVCSYAVYLKPAEVRQAPHGRDDPDEECSEWKFFSAKDGLPQEVRDELHAKRNVTLALAGLGSPEGIDFGEGLAVASESNRALVVPKGGGSAPKRGNDLKKSEWQPSGGWHDGSLYPRVTPGAKLGELTVGERCDNQSSIGASLLDYSHMGLREVPVEHLVEPNTPLSKLYYSADDHVRVKQLMRDIGESKRIDPLIVVTEPKGPYVLEGGHRIAAMHLMGMKSVPARVVRNDEEEWPVREEAVKKSEVDELLQHPDPLERSIALRLQGVSPHHLIRALHDPHPDVRATAARHPGVDAHVLLGFMAAPSFARQEQLQLLRDHPAVTSDHVRALVGFVARDPNGEAPETVRTLAQNPLLDEDSVRVLWDLGDQGSRMLLVGHPACPPDLREGVVLDELRQPLGASTAALAVEALAHPLAGQLRASVLRSGRGELVSALAGAPDLEPELVDEVLQYGRIPVEPDTWADARVKVLSGTNVTKQHLDTALEDRHPAVRAAVFSSPSPELSRAHVLRAIARGEPDLATVALRSRVGGLP